MFGGKRERALEEELMKVKEQNARSQKLLGEIAASETETLGQIEKLSLCGERIEKDLLQMEEHVTGIAQLAKESTKAAGDVHSALISANNAVGTFDVNHSVFMGQVKKQKDKVKEISEQNKQLSGPVDYLAAVPQAMSEDSRYMHEKTEEMRTFSKNMEVLALNAAIEAGRLGDQGSRFIHAAEEVRNFSEKYDQAAAELKERLDRSDARIAELKEQAGSLSGLLKEHNTAMGRLLQDCMQQVGTYEAGQLELKDLLSDSAVGRADALQLAEQEILRIQEQMKLKMGEICEAFGEQKTCTGELETICKGIQQSVQ